MLQTATMLYDEAQGQNLSCLRRLAVHLQNRLQLRTQVPGTSIRPHVADRLSNWTDFRNIFNDKF